jgi:uncharacterized protein involved in exopolysaccharide biosynthesis
MWYSLLHSRERTLVRLTTYTENQKIDALKLWLVLGNLHQVARDLKIPFDTVKQWRYSKWWADLAVEIKSEGRLELSAKLRKVAEKALGETLDRLENGDVRLSPTGQKERVPVTAAVASKIATDFLAKSEELDRTQDNETLQTVNDRLLALATSFEKFSRKVRRIEVEDVPQDIIEGDFHERQEQLGAQNSSPDDSDGTTGEGPQPAGE